MTGQFGFELFPKQNTVYEEFTAKCQPISDNIVCRQRI